MADPETINVLRGVKDLAGNRFGRLVAVSRSGARKHGHAVWICHCDCGAVHSVGRRELLRGDTRSCGCLNSELVSLRMRGPNYGKPIVRVRGKRRENPTEKLNGLSRKFHAEYQALQDAIKRCHRPNTKSYVYYGARGITVCDRWRFGEGGVPGFLCFLKDMGPRPPGMTIDRTDNDGNYEPGNCRWVTWDLQWQNQRKPKARAA